MLFERIRSYFGQQNFALTATNTQELCILRNQSGGRAIFVTLIDNTKSHVFGASHIASVQSQLENMTQNMNYSGCDVLFVVITGNVMRDQAMTQVPGAAVWLVSSDPARLLVYENQPYDFYGMRQGIEESLMPPRRETIFGGETVYDESPRSGSASKRSLGTTLKYTRVPYVTIALIAINMIWYIVLAAGGNTTDSYYMIEKGGNVAMLVFGEMEIWRLFTAMFMHFGIMHLFSNMLYLGFVGTNVERTVGHLKYFLIYMLSGIGAGVVSAAYYSLTNTVTVSAGASGAIYGVIGTLIYLLIRNRSALRSGFAFLRIGIAIVFIFYSSVLNSTVDGAAHIGGFIIGFILSFLFLRNRNKS